MPVIHLSFGYPAIDENLLDCAFITMAFPLRSSFPCRSSRIGITRPPLASLTRSRLLSTTPFVIRPSKQEIEDQILGPRNLELAVRHIHQDGLVVVEDVVPHDHLDFLNEKMVQDARTLQARGEDGPFNYNQGNLQLDAPPIAEYFQPSIFTSTPPPPPPRPGLAPLAPS